MINWPSINRLRRIINPPPGRFTPAGFDTQPLGRRITVARLAAPAAPPNHPRAKRLAQLGLITVLLAAAAAGSGQHIPRQPDRAPTPSSMQVISARMPHTPQAQINQAVSPEQITDLSVPQAEPAHEAVGNHQKTELSSESFSTGSSEKLSGPETPLMDEARLSIPALGVDQPVTTIGIRDGQWDISSLGAGVGWLTTTGTHPGDDLAMAFVGHITLSATRRGPFANLLKLRSGADVIYSSGGKDYLYTVRAKASVPPEDVAQLYVPDGRALLLVTCTNWDYLRLTYGKRLIVRAELVKTLNAEGETP